MVSTSTTLGMFDSTHSPRQESSRRESARPHFSPAGADLTFQSAPTMNNDLIHRFQSACRRDRVLPLSGHSRQAPRAIHFSNRRLAQFRRHPARPQRSETTRLLLCEPADGSSLPEPDFHQQCTTGLQIARRLLEEPPMDTHAIRTSGQCQSRLKAPDLRFEAWRDLHRQYREDWTPSHQSCAARRERQSGPEGPLKTINARIASVLNHIALRDGQGLCRYVDSDHARGAMPAPRTQPDNRTQFHIHDGGGWMIGTTTNCLCDQQSTFRTWDQNRGVT